MRRFFSSWAIVAAFACNSAHAVPETEIATRFSHDVMPWFQAQMAAADFTGVDGATIRYYALRTPGAQCALVFAAGRTEPSIKYAELFYDLKDTGCDLFSIDHRGQGFSSRLIDNPKPSYVARFSDYVDDFSYLVNEIVKPKHYKRAVLLSHSMGGPITAGYLQEYSGQFTHVVMTAPMMEINTFAFNQASAELLASALNDLGFGDDYVPGEHDYDPARVFPNCNTTSKPRFEVGHALENSLPQLQLGGASIRWVKESLEFTADLRKTPSVFQVPTTLYQAGADSVVLPDGQNQICSLSPGFCNVVRFPAARHEILFEQDFMRDVVMKEIRTALQQ